MADPAPTPLLESTPEEGSRRLALRWLGDATKAAERVLASSHDEEALHDLRVALRKLRTVLRTYQKPLRGGIPRKRRHRLRDLVRATGVARDSEVQLAWLDGTSDVLDDVTRAGVRWLRDRLIDRRDAAYARLRSATVPALLALVPKLRRDLSTYEIEHEVYAPEVGQRFADLTAELVLEQAGELAQALRRVQSVEDEELAHEARIHGKRLRYLLEPLRDDLEGAREVTKILKGLQDLLGEANDVAVRTRALREELASAALERARRLAADAERDDERALREEVDEQPGLLALVRITHHRRQELFDALSQEWIGDGEGLDRLLASVRSLVASLRAPAETEAALPREIERKYLLRALPERAREVEPIEIDQGYLPGEELHERLRRMRHDGTERLYRCVKLGKGISRIEIEEETTPEIYAKLWALTKGRRVRKRRYEIDEGPRVFQIDEFVDRELVLCEVELTSEHEAVSLPEWLAPLVVREVTGEDEYVNVNLAR